MRGIWWATLTVCTVIAMFVIAVAGYSYGTAITRVEIATDCQRWGNVTLLDQLYRCQRDDGS